MIGKNVIFSIGLLIGTTLNSCSNIQSNTDRSLTNTSIPITSTPAGELGEFDIVAVDSRIIVKKTGLYQDEWGGFYAIGEIKNISDQTLSNIHILLKIKDKTGKSLLQDENYKLTKSKSVFPLLNILAPGRESPFIYYLPPDQGIPFTIEAVVEEAKSIENIPAYLIIKSSIIVKTEEGMINISGEIINQSNNWVQISGLAAAVINKMNNVVSTDLSGTYASILAPSGERNGKDRTPFIASIPDPGVEFSDTKYYLDASVFEAPQIDEYEIELTNKYFDQYGSYHLVGKIKNNNKNLLKVNIIAGLYDIDSNVLDADYVPFPYFALPGDTIPFEISNFRNVNYNKDLAKRINSVQIQLEENNSHLPANQVINLKANDIIVKKDGSSWNFQGIVKNTSIQSLLGEIIFVSIYDGSGNLSASGYTFISTKGDFILPGDSNSFSFFIELDPKVISTDYSYKIFVQGDVK